MFTGLTPDDLSFLVQLARRAGQMALQMQATSPASDKADGSVVTEADVQVETLLRHELGRRFAGVPVLGEEQGFGTGSQAQTLMAFVVDPIDGTLSYAHGDALWAVSIGLLRAGKPVAGVVVAPALGRAWWAAEGLGAWREGKRLDRAPTRLTRHSLIGLTTSAIRRFGAPPRELGHLRCLGAIALQFALCADNSLDAVVTRGWSVWDVAAGAAILAEAGGKLLAVDRTPSQALEVEDLTSREPGGDLIAGGPNLADLVPEPLPCWTAQACGEG